jgi:hypothetical protein
MSLEDAEMEGLADELYEKCLRLERELAAAKADAERLREALTDMYAGWKYIRSFHGDLYGVGWDRAQNKAEAALAKEKA